MRWYIRLGFRRWHKARSRVTEIWIRFSFSLVIDSYEHGPLTLDSSPLKNIIEMDEEEEIKDCEVWSIQ